MTTATSKLNKATTYIAFFILATISVLAPLAYFVLKYNYEFAILQTEAETDAVLISQVISKDPEMWFFQHIRLEELLSRRLLTAQGEPEIRRIVDRKGNIIAESLLVEEKIKPPYLTRTHDLYDSGNAVARIEISRSLRSLIGKTLWIWGVVSIMGAALFIFLKRFPMSALSEALKLLDQEKERFRAIFESALVGVAIIDKEGKIIKTNNTFKEMFHYADNELTGMAFTSMLSENSAENYLKLFNDFTEGKQSLYRVEGKYYRKDDTPMWGDMTIFSVKDEAGNFKYCFVTMVDITMRKEMEEALQTELIEHKKAEEELRVSAERLQKSNKELQEFAYVASHDLQEPLRKITAFGDRLKGKIAGIADEQGKDYLNRMDNAARRMQTLIDGLLAYSRVTTKAQPFVSVSLAHIVKEVLSDLEARIEETKGRVEVGDLPAIEADPLQMRQLLQNLIGNALKFHRKEELPVVKIYAKILKERRLSSGYDLPDDELCQIMVQDNGIGFDEKYVERIFGVFQRLHGHDEYEGTGIGLAVCKKIAERHHGGIAAKSVLGQGSTFIVTLPVKQHGEGRTHE